MLYNREVLSDILAQSNKKEIILLTGDRQTGKTTLLKQTELEIRKNRPCFFLNLENLEFVKLLNDSPENLFKIFPLDKNSKKRQCVFVDEVQYLRNPTNFLKYIYDEYVNNIQLIVSGSSAFYIDKKFKDSLAGRKKIFRIYPLSLRDFLIFKKRSDILEYLPKSFSLKNFSFLEKFPLVFKKDMEVLLEELMIYGGYPRVVLAKDKKEKISLLEEIANAYIKKDILEADIKEGEKYYDLLKILSTQIGGQINANELANTLNLSRPTINHYLYIMQKSFHFALIRPFSRNRRKEIAKMPKGYFYDIGLRNYFINNFNSMAIRQDPGQILENFVFKQLVDKLNLDDIKYWRTVTGDEIDFLVKEEAAFEVKYRSSGFVRNKYNAFTEQYKRIPLRLVSHVIAEKDRETTWNTWLI
jgi:predicted AAA+ superfamily ATPase